MNARPSARAHAVFGLLLVACAPETEATLRIALTPDLPDAPSPPVDALRLRRCDDRLGATVLVDEDATATAPAGPWCGLDLVMSQAWIGTATLSDGRPLTFDLVLDDVSWQTDEPWTGIAWTLTFADGAEAVFLESPEPTVHVDASSPAAWTGALRAVTLRATDADVDAPALAVWPLVR